MTAKGITVDAIRDEVYDERERIDCDDCGHCSFVVTLRVHASMEEPGEIEGYCECDRFTCEDDDAPCGEEDCQGCCTKCDGEA